MPFPHTNRALSLRLHLKRRSARILSRSPFRRVRFRLLKSLVNMRTPFTYGTPIVRHYWADFLDTYRKDIHGRALEIHETDTIRAYGGTRLFGAQAIDVTRHAPDVTVIADLCRIDSVPEMEFDCFVNQFTNHVLSDIEIAIYNSLRLLKPGGVLLTNFAAVEYDLADGLDMGTGVILHSHWQFTPLQVQNIFRRLGLSDNDFSVQLYGNLLTRLAYELNIPAEELPARYLREKDEAWPLLICVRAVRPVDWDPPRPVARPTWVPSGNAKIWNSATGHQ